VGLFVGGLLEDVVPLRRSASTVRSTLREVNFLSAAVAAGGGGDPR
jgi:hypothetical protein